MEKGKVVVGLSGGVDSTVAAYLLKQQGYEVIGVTMDMWQGENSQKAIADASRIAEKLGIAYHVLDMREDFRRCVVDDFIRQYQRGQTPNPCIVCNRWVKGQALLEKAGELGASHIATGHYARIERHPETGRFAIRNSVTAAKDQTYALYRLTQEQLAAMLLPIGDYEKEEVRKIAEGIDGFVAKKGDSQDICFIPDGDYGSFLERFTGRIPQKGNFVDESGRVLGQHSGAVRYTLGQRRGLGIAAESRLYVVGKDMEKNTVTLGKNEALFQKTLYADQVNLIACDSLAEGQQLLARVRYQQKEQPCRVWQTGENTIRVEFDAPQRAIVPGQAVVLYDGDVVVGGGTITG